MIVRTGILSSKALRRVVTSGGSDGVVGFLRTEGRVLSSSLTNSRRQQSYYCSHHHHRRRRQDEVVPSSSVPLPLLFRNNNTITQHHSMIKRNMVTVTKTKVSTLPENDFELDDDNSNSSNTNNNTSTPEASSYKIESDGLIVTSSCLKRVEKLIEQRQARDGPDGDYFLRVFVDAGGCSGFQYQFEIDNEFDDDEDIVVVSLEDKPRIVIDETSMGFLNGATLDYVIEMIKSSFVIKDNPQSESACGCGSSFAMKNFTANPASD